MIGKGQPLTRLGELVVVQLEHQGRVKGAMAPFVLGDPGDTKSHVPGGRSSSILTTSLPRAAD